MQTVVLSILLLGSLSALVKLSLLSSRRLIAWSLLIAFATGLSGNWASQQSKTQIADFLGSPTMMSDVAVLLTIEVAVMIVFCLLQAGSEEMKVDTRNNIEKAVSSLMETAVTLYPGCLLFVAIFCLHTSLIFRLTGVSFTRISWCTAAAVLIVIPLATTCISKMFKEKSLRLESLYFLNTVIGVLGVVATVNGRTAVAGIAKIDWPNLMGIVTIVAITATVGLLLWQKQKRT